MKLHFLQRNKIFIFAFVSLFLCACSSYFVYAPVSDIAVVEKIPSSGIHIVRKGETFYAIAWRYGMDHKLLATINNISFPWPVREGQIIYLKKRVHTYKESRISTSKNINHIERKKQLKQISFIQQDDLRQKNKRKIRIYRKIRKGCERFFRKGKYNKHKGCFGRKKIHSFHWQWPVKGKLYSKYSNINHGISIAGTSRSRIFAVEDGYVVYAGNGLRGYGNLIIIKHSDSWLSAYAWNREILVQEGQKVHRSQQIAKMGLYNGNRFKLYFEIRYNGKSVNPLKYLPRRL